MKLEIPVKVYFDDVQGMIDEIKRLQTYKLFEGDDMVLVDLDAVVAIMANHIRATDNCSESPNGWIPCSERLPENGEQVLVYARSVHYALAKYDKMREADGTYKKQWVTFDAWKPFYTIKEVIAWMPLPEQWKG